MRSLQVKFITLVVGLLVTACVGLAWIATQHERAALQSEVGKRARALVRNLAGDAKEPLLIEDDLTLDALVAQAGQETGVVEARLLVREGKVAASLAPEERGTSQRLLASPAAEGDPGTPLLAREGSRLFAAAPILFSGVQVGEAQVALDLDVLVEPVVRESTRQLTLVALVVVGLGIVGGSGFVTLLVRPIQRLRSGVEQLAAGDFTVRVPPTSRDEVGQLTRAFNEMGESLLKKDRVQNAFGRYVSDYVLSQLLESADGAELGGAEREVTILFADVRRFTRLSEGMKARDVVALLNEVFQRFSERILAAGGTIDKFIGDSVMAYFGAPAPQSDQALRAVKAAIEIQRAMAERSRSLASRPGKASDIPVEIGIGIHTGIVIVGNIGSDRRMDYTAVGDAVNVAHRLEKLAPPGEILVSEAVQRRVRGTIRLRFEGERQLSGRQEPVHVYAVELAAEPGGAALP